MTTNTLGLSTPQLAALSYGTVAVGYSLHAIIAPANFAEKFGFPYNPDLGRNAFVTATGGRTGALALLIIAFAMQDNTKAAGLVFLCCAVSGLIDIGSCYAAGKQGPLFVHMAGTSVLVGLGWYLSIT